MIDIVLIFSILLVSFIVYKYISNINIREEYKTKDISYIYIGFFFFTFICLLMGFALKIDVIKVISFCVLLVLLFIEIIKTIKEINRCNKKFREILQLKDYNINVGLIKKEMIASSAKNLFKLLATPFLVLEKGIHLILNLIF